MYQIYPHNVNLPGRAVRHPTSGSAPRGAGRPHVQLQSAEFLPVRARGRYGAPAAEALRPRRQALLRVASHQ